MAFIQAAAFLDRRATARRTQLVLAASLVITALISLAFGASGTSLWGALQKLAVGEPLSRM